MRIETTMYDTLLQLPLFQGLCTADFTSIIERVRFHFHSYKENEIIVRQGETCDKLIFLLSGEMVATTTHPTLGYSLSETFNKPYIVEPYSLFGIRPQYSATYLAHSEAKVLTIDKSYIFSELNNYEIFRLNFLNILSTRCQIANQKIADFRIGTLSEKFLQFFHFHCQIAEGKKELNITMDDLACLLNETRINVSRLLNDLHKKELIVLRRKGFEILALEKVIEELKN